MPRLLFEKTGNAVWVSHLDLMRLFQRAFKRAGLPLTHTRGFNPRPSVSIALPLSVGIASCCELLDFDLEGEKAPVSEIKAKLNDALVPGIRVVDVYDDGRKIKHLAYLRCQVDFEYDKGVPEKAAEALKSFFENDSIIVEKHSKNGIVQQDIAPMIRRLDVTVAEKDLIRIEAVVCCQNPTLNPMQLGAAVEKYLPEYKADFVKYSRIEIYDTEENIFR